MIEDAAGRSVAHVYFCGDEQRRGVTKQVSRAEAQRIAQVTARAVTEAAQTQKGGAPA